MYVKFSSPSYKANQLYVCVFCLHSLSHTNVIHFSHLQMVPVAGDIDARSIEAIFMDVALLSMRLGRKPLTIRLMPIPDKQAGEMTTFESQYLCNAPVLSIKKCPMQRQQSDTGDVNVDSISAKLAE